MYHYILLNIYTLLNINKLIKIKFKKLLFDYDKKAQKRIFINKIIYKYIIYFQQKVNNNFSIIF